VTDLGATAVIERYTTFNQGTKIITVNYEVSGESLVVVATEETTLVSGRSPAIIWENSQIISKFFVYPSPLDVNRWPLKVSYDLKLDSKVTIVLISADGSLIWKTTCYPGEPGGRKWANTVEWDGKNRHGKWAGSGAYLVKVVVDSKVGNIAKTQKIGVVGKK
jgi:hypothetical protein